MEKKAEAEIVTRRCRPSSLAGERDPKMSVDTRSRGADDYDFYRHGEEENDNPQSL